MPLGHDVAWLEKLHEDFVEAFRNNDLKALGDFYTEDAVLLPPGRPMVSGRTAIVAYWQGAERIQDLAFEATDTRMIGTAALREAGNLLVTARGKGRDTRSIAAKYVVLWLAVDGGWKIDSTTWNNIERRGAGQRRRGGGGGGGAGRGRRNDEGPAGGAQGARPGRGAGAGGGGGRGRQRD